MIENSVPLPETDKTRKNILPVSRNRYDALEEKHNKLQERLNAIDCMLNTNKDLQSLESIEKKIESLLSIQFDKKHDSVIKNAEEFNAKIKQHIVASQVTESSKDPNQVTVRENSTQETNDTVDWQTISQLPHNQGVK